MAMRFFDRASFGDSITATCVAIGIAILAAGQASAQFLSHVEEPDNEFFRFKAHYVVRAKEGEIAAPWWKRLLSAPHASNAAFIDGAAIA
jgi:hypothetical protein